MSGYWSTLVAGAYGRDDNRPTDRATLRAAAVELAARGLTPRDVAEALRLSEAAVRALLGESAA